MNVLEDRRRDLDLDLQADLALALVERQVSGTGAIRAADDGRDLIRAARP